MSQNTPCKFYHSCPSASGWCRIRQPDASCVPFLISAYNGMQFIQTEGNEQPMDLTDFKQKAIIKDSWAVCPYCGKKSIPLGSAMVKGLVFRCRASTCKRRYIIDTEEPRA